MKTFDSIVTSSTEKDRKNGRDMKKTMPPAPGYANHTDHVVEHHEYAKGVATEPLRKRQRLRNHCARFWIFWLIGIIVVNAILLPIFFLKIIPLIVQKIINDSVLPIVKAQIGASGPDQIALSFTTILTVPGGLSARFDPYNISSFNAFTPGFYPFTTLQMPADALNVKGSQTISISSDAAPVLNTTEVSKWVNQTLNGETTQFSFKGSTVLHFGALSAPVTLEKVITVPALNKLAGFNLAYFKLVLPAESDGTNMIGNITLPNASGMVVSFGELRYNMSVAGVTIGRLSISNALLLQGNNSIPFRATLDFDAVTNNLGTIVGNSSSLSGGNLQTVIEQGQSLVNGQHIGWVEAVLAGSPLTAELPLTQALQDGLGSFVGANSTSSLGGALGGLLGSRSAGAGPAQRATDAYNGEVDEDVLAAARLYRELDSIIDNSELAT